MATKISTLNVQLTAGTGSFSKKMKGASSVVGRFARSAGRVAKSGALIGAALGGVAAAGIAALTKRSMIQIDATAKLSRRLGITTEKLAGLQHAADQSGVGADELNSNLEKMVRRIGEAAQGSGEAGRTIKQLGLDAQTMANMSPDQQLNTFADALEGVENKTQKVQMAYNLFGRSGISMLNMLDGGSSTLADYQKEAEKLGLTLSKIDGRKVEMANDAVDELGKVVTGAGQTLAVELSPFIQAAAEYFTDLGTSGGGMSEKVVIAVEWVANAVATLADWIEIPRAAFNLLQAGAGLAIAGVLKSVDLLGRGIVSLANLIPGVDMEFTSLFGDMASGMITEAEKQMTEASEAFNNFQTGGNSEAVKNTFAEIKLNAQAAAEEMENTENANKESAAAAAEAAAAAKEHAEQLEKQKKNAEDVKATLQDLQAEVQNFGKSEAQIAVQELMNQGASDEQIAEAQGLMDRKTALEDAQKEQERLAESAKAVFDETRTPLENYEKRLDKLNELVNEGTINYDTYKRAVRQAIEERDSATGVGETPQVSGSRAAAIEAGSAEAALMQFESQRQQPKRETLDEKQLGEAELQTSIMRDMVHAIKDGNTQVGIEG